jgi:hypothetical protein
MFIFVKQLEIHKAEYLVPNSGLSVSEIAIPNFKK